MKKWLRRIQGAVLMGLTWAVVWAPIGVLIGTIVDPDESMDEMWFLIGAYPGFLGGVVFSILLWFAEDRRRFDELSLLRFGVWGAACGLLLSLFPVALVAMRIASPASPAVDVWPITAAISALLILLSAISASGSLMLARMMPPWRTLLVQLLASDESPA